MFKPVVIPNDWQREVRDKADQPPSAKSEAYRAYFQILIDELREKHKFTGARIAQPQNWYTFSSGVSAVNYSTSFAQGGRVRVELYIDQKSKEANKALFDSLVADAKEIELAIGEPLEWERLDNRRACRIAVYRKGSIEQTPEELAEIRNWSIDRLLRLKQVLGPRVTQKLNQIATIMSGLGSTLSPPFGNK